MNFKLKTFILSTVFVNVLFLNTLIAIAQEEQPKKEKTLYCYEFLSSEKPDVIINSYKFCTATYDEKLTTVDTPINGHWLTDGPTLREDTVCLDDYNKVKNEGEFGTHCGPKPAEETAVSSIDACSNNKNLKDCIAARLPTKSGVSGVAPVSGNLLQNVAKVVNSALGLLGLIFTTLLIYAGIQWIHYGGDSEGLKRASKRIKNAIIGLMITLSAYSISYYILSNLAN